MISTDTLPDDVLLAIFDYYVNDYDRRPIDREKAWQSLVHVCRRWRSIVFGSPLHLNLRLVCTETTRARDMLDVWPALPLIIWRNGSYRTEHADNITAVLERSDRVCRIRLTYFQGSDLGILLAAMQQSFPELTDMKLSSYTETVPVVPDSFLGGSAPRLQYLDLIGIPFPGLPKLLLSATQLVHLSLLRIAHSGYFSPEEMVTALTTLTSLEELSLYFQSPRSCPDHASQLPPSSTRSVLPVLRHFSFQGVIEYLEDLVTHIDAPRLRSLDMTFFNDITFDTPEFIQFVTRSPTLRALKNAHITLRNGRASLDVSSQTSGDGRLNVTIRIVCRGLEWQVSSLEQVCTSLPSVFMLEGLYIYEDPYSQLDWKDDIENGLWLQLLHPFTAVKNLYLSERFAIGIGLALQELVEGRTTEVLPALQNIFLKGLQPSGPVQEGIRHFVASRQVTSRPITVSHWDAS